MITLSMEVRLINKFQTHGNEISLYHCGLGRIVCLLERNSLFFVPTYLEYIVYKDHVRFVSTKPSKAAFKVQRTRLRGSLCNELCSLASFAGVK